MQALQRDLAQLCHEWDVWSVVSVDAAANQAVIHRSDDDQDTVTITIAATYPRGAIQLSSVFGREFSVSGKGVAEALDLAMEQWSAQFGEEDGEDGGMGGARAPSTMYELESGLGGPTVTVDQRVLDAAAAAIDSEVADVNAASPGGPCCGRRYDAVRKVHVIRVGVRLQRLGRMRSAALGLDPTKLLAVDVSVPWDYAPAALVKVGGVVQCTAAQLSQATSNASDPIAPRDGPSESVGGLRWFLTNRINDALRKNYIARDRKANPALYEGASAKDAVNDWKFAGPWEEFTTGGNTSFVRGLHRVLEYRVENCTGVCLICDRALGVDSMKTAVCDAPLCAHSLETYGIGTDVLSEVTKAPLVCELLVFLSIASARAGTQRDTFTPMCPVSLDRNMMGPSYTGPINFFTGDGGGKNFSLLCSVIEKFPTMSAIMAMAEGRSETLRTKMRAIDPLAYPLLQWILASNRAHLEPLDRASLVKDMGAYQFHLVSGTPEKERVFRQKRELAKAKHKGVGSFKVWHGSAPNNWHCILRMGLKNYSNSKFMSAGAAYGPGIYTAKSLNISLGYMGQPCYHYPNAEFLPHKTGCTLVALCEIVNDPAGFKDHGNDIVTIQDETLVMTRCLFVFPDGFKGNQSLKADTVTIPEISDS